MLLKLIERLVRGFYIKNASEKYLDCGINQSNIKTFGKKKIPVQFEKYQGKEFKIDIPKGFKVKENDKMGTVIITKNFTGYNVDYTSPFVESYIHIMISRIKFEQSLQSDNMGYDLMKKFILRSPAFNGFESEDMYIGGRQTLSIKSNNNGYAGEIRWILVPFGKNYFNIRITSRYSSDIELKMIEEIIQSFRISSEEGENSIIYNCNKSLSAGQSDKYDAINIDKSYFSKTDAI